MSFSSDFIVGLPSETEEDFRATMQVIEEVVLMNLSAVAKPRPNTPASEMSDNVRIEEKERLETAED